MHGYVYFLDGIVTANGEVGISGSRSSPCLISPLGTSMGGGQRQQPVYAAIVVNKFISFQFHFISSLKRLLARTT
jgi:hypothetical protein